MTYLWRKLRKISLTALIVAMLVGVFPWQTTTNFLIANSNQIEDDAGTVLVQNAAASDSALQDSSETLKVATKVFEPFVRYESETSSYQGFSIDLWQAIAERLGLDYQLTQVESIDSLLDTVKDNTADVAIAGISITAQREKSMDFSHSYYESGLQIMIPERGESGLSKSALTRIWQIVTRPQLYYGIGIFCLILLVAAHVIWFTERQHNPEFPANYLAGIWESFWWAAVTVTTVGYGDKTPRRLPGRIFGLIWMCAGYFIFAYFTATVTTSFTLNELNATIRGIEDLRGKQVAAVIGTSTNDFLKSEKIAVIPYQSKEAAIQAVEKQQVEAFVYDAPALQYYVKDQGFGKVKLVGDIFEAQSYGIALPLNSPYRKPINSALLQIIEDGTYAEIKTKWFGEAEAS